MNAIAALDRKEHTEQALTVLCADIGGSKLAAGLADQDGRILVDKRYPLTDLSPDTMVREVVRALREVAALFPGCTPAAIGATIPGLADAARGVWVESSFSGIRNVPIAGILEEALGLPAFILNDIQACALAERRFGCCRDTDDFLWVTVSNGIGGAVFSNGQLMRGSSGNAGEIGHVIVVEGEGARLCKCGNHGCAEIHASGRAIPENYRELGGSGHPGAKEIAELARKGDSAAIRTWQLEGVLLGRAIGAAVNLLNPAKVVIGGGVSHSFDLFENALRDTLGTHIYRSANPSVSLQPSPLYDQAGLLGAACLAWRGIRADMEGGFI